MWFDPRVNETDLPTLIDRAIEIGTWNAWKARFQSFKDQVRQNDLMKSYFEHIFPIENALLEVIEYRDKTGGRLPGLATATNGQHQLYEFAAALARTHDNLSQRGATKFASRVRGALTDRTQSLSAIAFELSVITSLMHHQVDIFCNDIEATNGGAAFDFIARKDGLEVEIECKCIGPDIGRQVHRKAFYEVAGGLRDLLLTQLATRGSLVVDVSLRGPLREPSHVTSAINLVRGVVSGAANSNEAGSVSINKIGTANTNSWEEGGWSEDRLRKFVEHETGHKNSNCCLIGVPNAGAVVFVVRSEVQDSLSEYIRRNLSEAARQLSGNRPGIVWAHMRDMTPDSLKELIKPADTPGHVTEFQRLVMQFFESNGREHIFALRLSTPGSVRESQEVLGSLLTRSYQASGAYWQMRNPKHPLLADRRMSVFK